MMLMYLNCLWIRLYYLWFSLQDCKGGLEPDEVENLHLNLTAVIFLTTLLHEHCFRQIRLLCTPHFLSLHMCLQLYLLLQIPSITPSINPTQPVEHSSLGGLLESSFLNYQSSMTFCFFNYCSTCKNSSLNTCLQPGDIRCLFMFKLSPGIACKLQTVHLTSSFCLMQCLGMLTALTVLDLRLHSLVLFPFPNMNSFLSVMLLMTKVKHIHC